MTLDMRREKNRIFKELEAYQGKVGETVVWFKFDVDESAYDRVYDEGGQRYLRGRTVRALWVDQIEDPESYGDEGRRPTQRLRMAVSSRVMAEAGVGSQEAHGGRLRDEKPSGKPWWDDRLNDLIYYDSRFYEVTNFQIRGRGKDGDVVIGISGIETQPNDERVWQLFPGTVPQNQV